MGYSAAVLWPEVGYVPLKVAWWQEMGGSHCRLALCTGLIQKQVQLPCHPAGKEKCLRGWETHLRPFAKGCVPCEITHVPLAAQVL